MTTDKIDRAETLAHTTSFKQQAKAALWERLVRVARADDQVDLAALSERFGIDRGTVLRILRGAGMEPRNDFIGLSHGSRRRGPRGTR